MVNMGKERNTRQKEAIIKFLKKNECKHLSISDIKSVLGNEIGLTTIYRIINALIAQGSVIKIPLSNAQGYCYQYNSYCKKRSDHYHLMCEKCGKLIHFDSEELNKTCSEALKKQNFEIDSGKITILGTCGDCRENRK